MLSFLSRNWFPLSLVALFVFALPGIILSFLSLFGLDNEVNIWLQENLPLSYHPALPPLVTTLFLLLPVAIIILYFLKLKRKPLQVPSTFLWKKSIEDLHVNSLFQWLRENILLVLQVLIVLFMIYAALGIRFHGSTGEGKHYILLIDNSASMAATDVAPSRLHWAKQEALKEIDGSGENDVGMVIVFNSKATTLQTYTNNRGKLREVVRSIEQTQRPTRIEEALSLAESLANPVRSTEDQAVQPENVDPGKERMMVPEKGVAAIVHLYSDGKFAKLTDSALANLNVAQTGKRVEGNKIGNLNLVYHRAGVKGADAVDNIGITGLSAVRILDKKKAGNTDVGRLRVLVQVHNFRNKPAKLRLNLDVYSGGKMIRPEQTTIEVKERTLRKGDPESDEEDKDTPGETQHSFELPPMDLRGNIVLHAYLPGNKDDFPLDDNAWLALGSVRKASILIVGPGNAILEAFFDNEATKRLASVQHMEAKDLGSDDYRKKAAAGAVDLVIFDRCAPEDEADMPQANTVFIDRPPPPWKRGAGKLKNPTVFVSKGGHRLLRFLSTLYDIGIDEAFTIDFAKDVDDKVRSLFALPEGDPKRRAAPVVTKLLETSQNVPVLFTMGRGSYTDLVMTFPLVADGALITNWPLQPSFPLFLRNVLYTLANVDDADRTVSVQPGEPMVLRPEAGVQSLRVTSPDDKSETLERGNRPDFVYSKTDQVGVYKVERLQADKKEAEGAEVPSADVRNFAVNLLDVNESNIEPREEIRIGSGRIATNEARPQPRDLWKWILLVAVVLLTAEWYIYNRRVSL